MCCAAKVQTVSSVEELQKTTPIVLVRATKKGHGDYESAKST